MLKKVKVTITALGLTGLMGAGSLFSGIAVQNIYAQDDAGNKSAEMDADDIVNMEISNPGDESNGSSESVSAEASQNNPVTDNSEGNTPADSSETEKKTEDISSEKNTSVKESANNNTGISNSNKEKSSYNYNSTGKTDNSNSVKAKNGWVKEKGGYKYYKNGKAYTGWHKMGKAEGEKTEHYSYFGSDGIIRTGWQSMGKGTQNSYNENNAKHVCYFGGNGWLRTGWQSMGKGTQNSYGENTAKHMSYFGSNGWLRTGWVQLGRETSEPDGNVAKHWSYFGNNGWLRTGWVELGKGTSEPDGNVAKHWSYFGNNGWLRTGWQDMGKGTRNPDGNSEKHKSYFGSDGWLRTGNQEIQTGSDILSLTPYSFDDKGWLMDAYYEDGKKFTGCYWRSYGQRYNYCWFYNGKEYTGNLSDIFPKEYKAVEYENTYNVKNGVCYDSRYAKRRTKKVSSNFSFDSDTIELRTPLSVNGLNVMISGESSYGIASKSAITNNSVKITVLAPSKSEITLKIDGDVYSAKTVKVDGKYGSATIHLKRNYKAGTRYTVTASYGGSKGTATGTVKQ